jgi:hypothetical protein
MSLAYGGLQIAGGSTPITTAVAAAKVTAGWAAIAAAGHGDLSIVPSAANSRLTLKPGVYLVTFSGSAEQTGTSGISEVGVVYETTFQLYKDQAAIAGMKAVIDSDPDEESIKQVHIQGIVEVAAGAAGQLEVYISSSVASLDVIVREGQFNAVKLD